MVSYGDGDAIEDDIDNDIGEVLMLIERDAELVKVAEKLGAVEGLE